MACMVGKVVLARVCSMHFSSFQPAAGVLVVAAAAVFLKVVQPSMAAWFVFAGGVACYLHLANYVILVLSNNLCIYAFQVIPRSNPPTK